MQQHEERVLSALRRAGTYPWAGEHEEIREIHTHISAVFIVGDRVVKVKKARDFGFLNFLALEDRRHYCHQELRLNQRLSEGIYLDVRPIMATPDDPEGTLYLGEPLPEGEPAPKGTVEWCVVMRRISDDVFLEKKLEKGQVSSATMQRILDRLVSFYRSQSSTPDITQWGAWDAVVNNVRQNYEQTMDLAGNLFAKSAWLWCKETAERQAQQLKPLLTARKDAGWVIEGHGDLHAQHVLLMDDTVQFMDCIEFNDSFRCLDPLSDLAFLYMDLIARNHFFLADVVYRQALTLRDPDQDSAGIARLFSWFAAYRAMVRAKVISFALQDSSLDDQDREARRSESLRYFALHRRFLAFGCGANLVLLSGPAASGKSTLARQIQKETGFPRISSDATRKAMFNVRGKTLDETLKKDMYTADVTGRVYASLTDQLQNAMESIGGAILDATNLEPMSREPFLNLAQQIHARVIPVILDVSNEEIVRRLAQRARSPSSESDADLEIHHQQKERYQAPEDAVTVKGEGKNWASQAVQTIADYACNHDA